MTETFRTGEQYGFAVRTGADAVRSMLDDTLDHMRSDGTDEEIIAGYFGDSA